MPPNVPRGVMYTSAFIAVGMTGIVGYTWYEVYVKGTKPKQLAARGEQYSKVPHPLVHSLDRSL